MFRGLSSHLTGVLLTALAFGARAAETSIPATSVEPLVYAITINGQPDGETVLLRLDGKRLLARQGDWDLWHLRRPTDAQYMYEGEAYYDLSQAPGFVATLDAQHQAARLEFSPQAFLPSVLSGDLDRRVTAQQPPGLGSFLNYEFVATRAAPEGAAASSNLNGLIETGLFSQEGVATSQWLGLNLSDEEPSAFGATADRRVVRLDTAWTRDLPADMQTLRLGDGVGTAGLWGRPVHYGGVRWGRNFATQPGFVVLPQPALHGETALPSVLDVYVDGLRRSSLEVPPGPFTVENLPTVTGQGDIQIVVRDLLGREQVLTAPYITGAQQLRQGLHDYSYEAGFVRERFGQVSDDYGQFVMIGSHRYGFDDDLTGEARLEIAGQDSQTAGLGAVYALPEVAVFSNAFAVSHSDAGYGAMDVLTIQRNLRRTLSIGTRLQVATTQFTQVGATGLAAPLRSFSANVGYFMKPFGHLSLAYVNRKDNGGLPDFEATTATFTIGFHRASLMLIAIDRIAPERAYEGGVTLSVTFGARDSAAAGYRYANSDVRDWSSQSYARVQRNLPEQEGWGYRVLANQTDSAAGDGVTSGEVGVGLNNPHGSYGLEAATTADRETYRASFSGGLGAMAGHVFASRELSRSFAVVETGAEGLELLVNNRPAGRTDASGVAVLPYLQPYQNNTIRIDATNVPMDVEIRSGEFSTAPYYRSGVLVELEAARNRSAMVTLLLADGSAVPAGATARLGSDGAEFPVGRKGQTYLSHLQPGDNPVDVSWDGRRCRAVVVLPADAGMQPQLGAVTCQESP